MASDGLAVPLSRAHRASWIDEAVFLAFLLLAFVGLAPFAVHAPAVTAFGENGTTGAGDLARQLCYLAVLAVVLFTALRNRGIEAISAVPILLLLLLAWCLLSATWAAEPGVAFRRAGLAVVLVATAMLSVNTIGAERALVLWRWVLAAVLIVNIASIPFIPQAVHLPGEADPDLVGNWRGLYGHKNIAGSVGAMTAIIFLFTSRFSPGLCAPVIGCGDRSRRDRLYRDDALQVLARPACHRCDPGGRSIASLGSVNWIAQSL